MKSWPIFFILEGKLKLCLLQPNNQTTLDEMTFSELRG